jgi:hypothetical protein
MSFEDDGVAGLAIVGERSSILRSEIQVTMNTIVKNYGCVNKMVGER